MIYYLDNILSVNIVCPDDGDVTLYIYSMYHGYYIIHNKPTDPFKVRRLIIETKTINVFKEKIVK